MSSEPSIRPSGRFPALKDLHFPSFPLSPSSQYRSLTALPIKEKEEERLNRLTDQVTKLGREMRRQFRAGGQGKHIFCQAKEKPPLISVGQISKRVCESGVGCRPCSLSHRDLHSRVIIRYDTEIGTGLKRNRIKNPQHKTL